MKLIQLTQDQVAKVSDEWYDELNKFKWCAAYFQDIKSFYAVRMSPRLHGKRKLIMMHRVIAGTPEGMETDHKDGDTLNNLPDNLRNSTHAQNKCNSGKYANNTSGFKGVIAVGCRWIAQITVDRKTIYLGSYSIPEEAALAYNEAAKKCRGDFAKLNEDV